MCSQCYRRYYWNQFERVTSFLKATGTALSKVNVSQGTQKNFNVNKRSEINEFDKSSLFLFFDRLIFVMDTPEVILKNCVTLIFVMIIQEFILIPKSFYTQQNNSILQVLKDPDVERKAKSDPTPMS